MADRVNEARGFTRYGTDVGGNLTSPTLKIAVRMLSVSANGALLRLDRLSGKVFDDDVFMLEISGVGRVKASKKWRRDNDIGAKFELADTDRARLAAKLAERFGVRATPSLRPATTSSNP